MSPATTVTTLGCLLAAVIVVAAQSGEKHGHGHGGRRLTKIDKDDCMNKTDVTKEMIKEMKNGGEPSRDVGCFIACLMEKDGTMSANGTMVPPSDHCSEEMKACVAAITTTDNCEKALEAKKCHKGNRKNWGKRNGQREAVEPLTTTA